MKSGVCDCARRTWKNQMSVAKIVRLDALGFFLEDYLIYRPFLISSFADTD